MLNTNPTAFVRAHNGASHNRHKQLVFVLMHVNVSVARERMSDYVYMACERRTDYVCVACQRIHGTVFSARYELTTRIITSKT